jgi:hypothetical protein
MRMLDNSATEFGPTASVLRARRCPLLPGARKTGEDNRLDLRQPVEVARNSAGLASTLVTRHVCCSPGSGGCVGGLVDEGRQPAEGGDRGNVESHEQPDIVPDCRGDRWRGLGQTLKRSRP